MSLDHGPPYRLRQRPLGDRAPHDAAPGVTPGRGASAESDVQATKRSSLGYAAHPASRAVEEEVPAVVDIELAGRRAETGGRVLETAGATPGDSTRLRVIPSSPRTAHLTPADGRDEPLRASVYMSTEGAGALLERSTQYWRELAAVIGLARRPYPGIGWRASISDRRRARSIRIARILQASASDEAERGHERHATGLLRPSRWSTHAAHAPGTVTPGRDASRG